MKIQSSWDLSMEQPIVDEDSSEEFVVEEIVAKRYNNKTKEYEYLLKWEGYPSEQNTWEPYSNLTSCRYLIQNYEKQLYRKHLKNSSKSTIVLQKPTEQNSAADYLNDTECKSTDHSGKSAIKSLITLDGHVISFDSPEWKNHVKSDQFNSSDRVNESNQLTSQINGETSESYERNRSAVGVVESEERLQLPTSSSVDVDVPSDRTSLNYGASMADSFDLSSTDIGADGVNKTDDSNINSDIQSHVNVSPTSSVRTGPLPPPKKRIFDPSMLTESSSASKIIPDICRIVTPKPVTETDVPSDQSSDLDIKQNTTVADNKDDVCLEDLLQTSELEVKSPSLKGSEQLTLKTELDYKNYISGIHRKPHVLECKIKCGDPMLEELSIKNRIKNESSQSILSSGIYSFQKDSAVAYLDSECDDNSLGNVLTELIQTRKRILLADSQSNSETTLDLSTIFKMPEVISLSGTILQKEAAVSLGIYPNSKPAPETGVNSSHNAKPTVQRTETSSYEGYGTIKTKSSVPSESVYKIMSPKPVQKSMLVLPPAATVRSNLSPSTASKLDGGGFRTQGPSYSEQNRAGSGASFKRVSVADRVTKPLTTLSLEKKIPPNKTGTPNSSLRKLLGTFNPGRRSTDSHAISANDTPRTENDTRPIKEFAHLEPDFPTEINKDPWSPVKKVKLDPTSGKKLEDEHGSRSPAVSSPEHSPCSSPPRVPTDNNLSGVVIKAENQDVQDNHIEVNSEIDYQPTDGSAPVVLQVQVSNNCVKEEPVPVDMSSLSYPDGSVMNGNLVTITGEDGCLYQVENAKLEGDTILVSQEEEPQCIYELPDGSKVVRRLRIDGLPIFTLDDPYNNSLIQLAINDVSVLPDGSEIIIKQDETGHTLQINPPNVTQVPSDLVASDNVPISEPLQENGLPVTEKANGVQQVVATLLEAGEAPAEDGSRKVVLLMPDGNLMMTEVDEEQFAALELQK